MSALDRALTIEDLKQLARRRVPKQFFDYADSGAWTEGTYRANEEDFKKITFRQRVAVDMSNRSLATTMMGQPVAMPIGIAPVGSTGMQQADGEIKAAKAAEKAGIPFILSTMAICSIEDIAENTTAPFWYQLYVMKDRDFILRMIDRAKAAKCPVLVLTMDLQILGTRHKDVRNGLLVPPKFTPKFIAEMAMKPAWALGMLGTRRRTFRNIAGHVKDATNLRSLTIWSREQFEQKLNWTDVRWIKERFGGPVLVKGILDPEDARLAVANGADGIIVSNHGGRQLDGAPSSIRVLPSIVDAVGDQIEVFMDGGVRSGQDLLKALALGARGAFIGRAMVYGLGAGGEAGVTRALSIIREETDITMALLGERDIRNIGAHNVYSNDLERRQGY
ncbi:MAG TPA: alpha-hydroxy acid oxidase [Devosia sp.]|nr:alpha-hydroxy acid oxidase [Devosia sp.]